MISPDWDVELSSTAQADLREILRWTRRRFGSAQESAYRRLLQDALKALKAGPNIIGARQRQEIGPGYRTLHIGRGRGRARHFILFRVVRPEEDRVIRVVRILHDAMDPERHISEEER